MTADTENKHPDKLTALLKTALRRARAELIPPPVSIDRARAALAQLPPAQPGEDLGDRIRRASAEARATRASEETRIGDRSTLVLPENAVVIAEFVRLAADSGDEIDQLPDPDVPLEAVNGAFDVTPSTYGDKIIYDLTAINDKGEEYNGQTVYLTTKGRRPQVLAQCTLQIGRENTVQGRFVMEHSWEIVRALLGFQLMAAVKA